MTEEQQIIVITEIDDVVKNASQQVTQDASTTIQEEIKTSEPESLSKTDSSSATNSSPPSSTASTEHTAENVTAVSAAKQAVPILSSEEEEMNRMLQSSFDEYLKITETKQANAENSITKSKSKTPAPSKSTSKSSTSENKEAPLSEEEKILLTDFEKVTKLCGQFYTEGGGDDDMTKLIENMSETLSANPDIVNEMENIWKNLEQNFSMPQPGNNSSESAGDEPNIPGLNNFFDQIFEDGFVPLFKDIQKKFNPWLEKNKETLAADEFDRCQKQSKIVDKICNHLDKHEGNIPAAMDELNDILKELDALGSLPVELSRQLGDPNFLSNFQNMINPDLCNKECTLM